MSVSSHLNRQYVCMSSHLFLSATLLPASDVCAPPPPHDVFFFPAHVCVCVCVCSLSSGERGVEFDGRRTTAAVPFEGPIVDIAILSSFPGEVRHLPAGWDMVKRASGDACFFESGVGNVVDTSTGQVLLSVVFVFGLWLCLSLVPCLVLFCLSFCLLPFFVFAFFFLSVPFCLRFVFFVFVFLSWFLSLSFSSWSLCLFVFLACSCCLGLVVLVLVLLSWSWSFAFVGMIVIAIVTVILTLNPNPNP